MPLNTIDIDLFQTNPFHLLANKWMLLTAGDFQQKSFNTMTIAWGSFGVMWNKPFVQVVVRPTRYTHRFMEQYDTFTVCAFPGRYRNALQLLGSKSGRDGDKIAEAGLNPIPSLRVAAPAFAEAELILECRKIYWHDFDPAHFIDAGIHNNYPIKDYHRAYFGEILGVIGNENYSQKPG